MVQKRVCSFCGGDVEPGTGKMFVRKDGTVFFFCKLKCQTNMIDMGRASRWVRWTEVYARAKHGAVKEKDEAEVVPPSEEAAAEGEMPTDFDVHAPKGKDIPQSIADLIDHRFGPDLPLSRIDSNFAEFTASGSLRHSLGLWYKKRHPGKKISEVATSEYVAFLDTAQAKKLLKDWLDEKAKKEKGGK